ncbi:MAG: cyclic nucleotide-binding domain-containing protein [Proteobacteria bacterium]|nr:cyclic nucleotide-binding domain-containing protein [Pseudomonadota bacterium]
MEVREVRKLKDKAAKFIEKQKFSKALDIYDKLLQSEPNDVTLMLKVGELNRHLGHNESALEVYSQAAEHYAKDGMLLRGIAVCRVILDIDSYHTATQECLADLYTKKYGGPLQKHSPPAGEADEPEDTIAADTAEATNAETQNLEKKEPETEIEVDIDLSEMAEPSTEETTSVTDEAEQEAESVPTTSPVPTTPSVPKELPYIPLFSDLDRDSFIDLLGRMPVHNFKTGEYVVRQYDEGLSFYIIVAGSVRIVNENDIQLAQLEAGAFFGEMALVTQRPRLASVETLEQSEILEVSRQELDSLRNRFPHIGETLQRFAGQRLLHNLMLTSPMFTDFSPDERKGLMRRFVPKSLSKGENIIEQGQEGEGLYLIVSGLVEIVRENDAGEAHHLTNLAEGDIFGEIALLTHSKATATVRTAHKCDFLCLPKDKFNEIIMTHPQILMLISELSEKRQQDHDSPLRRDLATGREGGSALL